MPHDQPLGIASVVDGRWSIRFDRVLRHPPAKVWRALTESEHLAAWMPCDIVGERRAGATIQLPFWPDHIAKYGIQGPPLSGEIRVWDPPNVFEWTWDSDVLRWELADHDGGTRLTFQTWLGDDPAGAAKAAAGYHACLANLEALLDTGQADPLVDTNVAPLEARYAEAVTAVHQAGHDRDGAA